VTGLSADRFNRRPAPKRWSVAECLDHLNTIRKVLPAIDRTIEEAARRGLRSPGPFRYGWFARLSVRSMEPPPRFRMRTFRMLLPRETSLHADDVLREFLDVRDLLAERVRRADGVDLKRAIVVSPVTRLFRLPLGAYFAFLLGHDRRHLWQARRVLAELQRVLTP
jgi:DinB family protein